MPDFVEKEGPSVEEAVMTAVMALGINEEEAQIQVLSVAKSGRAKVRVGKPGVAMPSAEQAMQPVADEPRFVKPPASGRPQRPAAPAAPLTQEELEKLKMQFENVLEKMGTPGSISIQERFGNPVLSIESKSDSLLIGKKGANLQALQTLANAYLNVGHENKRVQVDVAGYRARREDELAEQARQYAQQAHEEGGQFSTGLLSAPDRRVVHLALQEMEDIETFSVGEGELKRVVIQKKKS